MKITVMQDKSRVLDFDEKNLELLKFMCGHNVMEVSQPSKGVLQKYFSAINKDIEVFDEFIFLISDEKDLFSIVTDIYDEKLVNFLIKVLPNNEIKVDKHIVKSDITKIDRIISDFMVNVGEYPVSYTVSLSEKLSLIDMEKLLLTLQKSKYSHKFTIMEYECDTCREHDEKHPIHLEMMPIK